jgi:hypothetical protein
MATVVKFRKRAMIIDAIASFCWLFVGASFVMDRWLYGAFAVMAVGFVLLIVAGSVRQYAFDLEFELATSDVQRVIDEWNASRQNPAEE